MIDWNILEAFSPYLIALLSAYFVGQFAKIIIDIIKKQRIDWREFFKSGNMPSTHTASMVALTTVIGFHDGWGSAVFAIAAATTLVVVYDAIHVRRAVGEQGLIINEMIDKHNKTTSNKAEKMKKPYFSRGHLPREVIVGGILGVFIGLIVSLLFA